MKNFYIFASIKNIYTGQVKKLKEESKLETKVVYIEEFVEKREDYTISSEDIIYFLCCNSPLVPEAINLLEPCNCTIINRTYLENNYKKGDIQNLLKVNNVLIPEIFVGENIEKLRFPIFCKENRHEGIIFQAYNKITLERFFEKFNILDFYFEEVIIDNGSTGHETKLYCVENEVFGKEDNVLITDEMKEICKNISKALNNLEVFSVDIIQDNDSKNYVIDVNPAAGFYLSDSGRKYFLDKIYNM